MQHNTVVVDQVDPSVNSSEPWTVFAHKKPQKGWVAYNPKTMRPPPLSSDTESMKVLSWNVNGLRALLKLESFSALQLAQREDFDVLCLQETKIQVVNVFFHCIAGTKESNIILSSSSEEIYPEMDE